MYCVASTHMQTQYFLYRPRSIRQLTCWQLLWFRICRLYLCCFHGYKYSSHTHTHTHGYMLSIWSPV